MLVIRIQYSYKWNRVNNQSRELSTTINKTREEELYKGVKHQKRFINYLQ